MKGRLPRGTITHTLSSSHDLEEARAASTATVSSVRTETGTSSGRYSTRAFSINIPASVFPETTEFTFIPFNYTVLLGAFEVPTDEVRIVSVALAYSSVYAQFNKNATVVLPYNDSVSEYINL